MYDPLSLALCGTFRTFRTLDNRATIRYTLLTAAAVPNPVEANHYSYWCSYTAVVVVECGHERGDCFGVFAELGCTVLLLYMFHTRI